MKKTISVLATLIACLSATSAMAVTTTYTDSASFLANVEAGSYYEDFSGVAAGAGGPLSFTDGVFSYDIDTAPSAPGTPPPGGLFNDPGIISTNTAGDAILVSFTGAPVTAVGGTFFASDINFAQIPSDVVVTLSDGTTAGFNGIGFSGFTSDSGAITSIEINTNDPVTAAWATIDELYVGTAVVPEPGSALLFFSSLIGLLAIRRK
jgi:hypothetical protein